MPSALNIILRGDGAKREWADGRTIHQARSITIAALKNGTVEGRPSISILIDLDNGDSVFAETTMRLFLAAANAFRATYGGEL